MKVTMKMKLQGSRNGVRWPEAGTVLDLPDGEAIDLCSVGAAVPFIEQPETAVAPAPETAAPKKRTAKRV